MPFPGRMESFAIQIRFPLFQSKMFVFLLCFRLRRDDTPIFFEFFYETDGVDRINVLLVICILCTELGFVHSRRRLFNLACKSASASTVPPAAAAAACGPPLMVTPVVEANEPEAIGRPVN